jgi:hypothetical protein
VLLVLCETQSHWLYGSAAAKPSPAALTPVFSGLAAQNGTPGPRGVLSFYRHGYPAISYLGMLAYLPD